jgi:hypothetical protein
MKLGLIVVLLALSTAPAFSQSLITFDVDTSKFIPGEIVELKGNVGEGLEGKPVAIEINDSEGNIILIRTVTSDIEGDFILKFKVPNNVKAGELDIATSVELDGQSFAETKQVEATEAPKPEPSNDPVCGAGTILQDGVCVVDTTKTSSKTTESSSEKSSKGGGCLIATATYGSELAPQVQNLRELRDNQLLTTESGTSFINTFNDAYYSFSPIIADYERENLVFKEMVKVAITPMITSLFLMEYAETETEVLGIGISVILLNIGMYFVTPTIIVVGIRKSRN